MRRFLIVLILLALLGFVVYDSIIDVPDGYAGVSTFRRSHLGRISTAPRILPPGLHLSLPLLTRMQLYNTRIQVILIDVPIAAGQTFRLTAQVRLDPDSAVVVHHRLGPNYLQDPPIRSALTALMQNEIFATHGKISSSESQEQLLSAISGELSRKGLILEEAILTRLERLDLKEETPAVEESDTDEDQD